jgi:hypothetical protein
MITHPAIHRRSVIGMSEAEYEAAKAAEIDYADKVQHYQAKARERAEVETIVAKFAEPR